MSKLLPNAWIKIERAKEKIGDLESRVAAFKKSDPAEVIAHYDPKVPGEIGCEFRVQPYPTIIPLIAGEILQCVASALDYLVYQLIPGAHEAKSRKIGFPFFRKTYAEGFEALFNTKVDGASPAAKNLIRGLKPYKDGNKLLWRLSELNNKDKHRLLLMAVGSFNFWKDPDYYGVIKAFERLGNGGPISRPMPVSYHEAPINFWSQPRDRTETDNELHYTFDIVFMERGIINNVPVVPFVTEAAKYVSQILKDFESLPELQ